MFEFDFALFSDKEFDFFFNTPVVFDDLPIEELFKHDSKKRLPTPADILEYWERGHPIKIGYEINLATIIARNIDTVIDHEKHYEAKILFLKIINDKTLEESPQIVLIYYALWAISIYPDINEGLQYYITARDKEKEWSEMVSYGVRDDWYRIKSKAQYFANKFYPGSGASIDYRRFNIFDFHQPEGVNKTAITPEMVREKALKYIRSRRYSEAEILYNQLLELQFEPPGTMCHLARVFLMTNRMEEARKIVEEAWQQISEAQPYVVLRILYFKLLFAFIDKSDSHEWIGMIKTAYYRRNSLMDWDIDFVVTELDDYLDVSEYLFLMDLQKAMGTNGRITDLNKHEIWKNQTEFPLPG